MAPMNESQGSKSRSRLWIRVSLRSFVVLLTIACLCLGWFVNRVRQQRRVVQWIEDAGGFVEYRYWNGDEISRFMPPPVPEELRDLIGIDYFATWRHLRVLQGFIGWTFREQQLAT